MTTELREIRTPDIPLLRKAVEWVEAQAQLPPEEREWFQGTWRAPAKSLLRTCGTCYCVAGKVCEDAGIEWDDSLAVRGLAIEGRSDRGYLNGHYGSARAHARALLGLNFYDADLLFDSANDETDIRYYAETFAGERL